MDLNSYNLKNTLALILSLEEDKINFEDKLSLAFMIIGAVFFGIIVVTLLMSMLSFEQVEFEAPFF